MSRIIVSASGPLRFDLALAYLRGSPSSVLEDVSTKVYSRAVRLNGKTVVLRVREAAEDNGLDGYTRGVQLELIGPDIDHEDEAAATALVRRVFTLDHDVAPLLDAVASDPTFFPLAQRLDGLRPVLIPDPFEATLWAIIGQQITTQFAAKCKHALAELLGERIVVDGREYLVFPTPERVASAREEDLAAIQFSRQKIRYTLNVARLVADGALDLAEIARLPTDKAQARLERIVGIGRWTAEYVLMRGLGHRDVIPAGDGGLRRIIGQAYGLGRSATEDEVRQIAQRWTGWRGYAAFYWWFTLQEQARKRRERRS